MENKKVAPAVLEDDAKEKISLLIEHRVPWLAVGFLGGLFATILAAQFEHLLARNLHLAYFIPVIVYMAGAVGSQTENVYVRNLGRERVSFKLYLVKECMLGIFTGLLFAIGIGIFAFIFFKDIHAAIVVSLAMFLTMSVAPILALVIPALIKKEHKDPAIGAGPFTIVVQDIISLLIYFSIASVIILGKY